MQLLRPMFIAAMPLALTACQSMHTSPPSVPAAVAVPAGNRPVMTLKGSGPLTYECRAKADTSGQHEWVFVGPNAVLSDKGGARVGKYYGGPTWEYSDGSKITGKQLAVSPASAGNIPLQLVQVNPGGVQGTFSGVTYIQRINTVGGVAPSMPCNASALNTRRDVEYSADYVFYRKQ